MKPRVLGWCLLLVPTLALAADAEPKDYFLIHAGEEVIGTIAQRIEATGIGRKRIVEQDVAIEAAGNITRIRETSETVEDRSGRPVRFTERNVTGSTVRTLVAVIGRDRITFTATSPQARRVKTIEIASNVRFDSGAGLLPAWVRDPEDRLEFENVDLDGMAIDVVTIEKIGEGAVPGTIEAIRYRGDGDEDFRGIAKLTIDADGNIQRLVQPMFGINATIAPTDRATAMKDRAAFKLLDRSMVKAPFRIQKEALEGHIRYRFGFKDGMSMTLPETGEQRRTSGADGEVQFDICGGCGEGLRTDGPYLDRARAATPWLESDHPRVRNFAAPIGKLKISDAEKMERLRLKARPIIATVDFAGHFSALQTLQRRRGDCTESAVLLAALGRAIGIPTKVANGLVYSRSYYHGVSNVFMPHSWTLAYVDGKWKSFDLALDTFDSSHLALTVGDGDPQSMQAASQAASLLEWKAVQEVRKRPAG